MKDLSGLGESELIELAREGNDRAFGVIVSRYEQQVARTAIGMLGDTDEAEDVGQETFIRFYRSLHKFRGESALGTYLTRIAINLSLNEINKKKKTISLFYKNGETDESMYEVPQPGDKFAEADSKEQIDKALQQIDPDFRSVIVLRLIEGYSTRETAKILNLPLGTVLSRLSRAQKNLREILTSLI